MPGELADEHVVAICQVLSAYHVSFVIIGGIAARLHQTGYATVDVDICPARDESNLTNLAAALRALGARLRVRATRTDSSSTRTPRCSGRSPR